MFMTTPAIDSTIDSMFHAFDAAGTIGAIRKVSFVSETANVLMRDDATDEEKFTAIREVFLAEMNDVITSTAFHATGPSTTGPVTAFVNRVTAADTPNIIGFRL